MVRSNAASLLAFLKLKREQIWHNRLDALRQDNEARQQLTEAVASKQYDLAYIYAGEAVGLVDRQQPAGDVIRALGEGAERLLRERFALLLDAP